MQGEHVPALVAVAINAKILHDIMRKVRVIAKNTPVDLL